MRKGLQRLLSLGVISALVLSLVLPTNVAYADEVSTESETVVTANEESYVETVSESEKAAAEKTEGENDESKKEDSEKIEEANDKKVEEKADESKKEGSEKIEETDDKKVEEKADESKKEDSEKIEEADDKKVEEQVDESKKEDSEKIEETDNKKVEEQTDESKKEESEEIEKTDDKKTEEKATKTESKKQDSEETEESEEDLEDEEEVEDEIEEEDLEAVLGDRLSSLTVSSTEVKIDTDTIVEGNVYISGSGKLTINSSHTLEVKGNVYIANKGELHVKGTLLVHGKVECVDDGNFCVCSGYSSNRAEVDGNVEANDKSKIWSAKNCIVGGDVIINSSGSAFGDFYIRGNYIDKYGLNTDLNITFLENRTHVLDMLEASRIARLNPNGNVITVGKYFNVGILDGKVVLSNRESEIITAKNITMNAGSTLTIPCRYITRGVVELNDNSVINVDRDWLCPSGGIRIAKNAIANIKGSLKLESTDAYNYPIKGTGALGLAGYCNVDGDFVINTSSYIWTTAYRDGQLSLKGNYYDNIGKDFMGTVIMLTKGKTITTKGKKINILYLYGNRNDYNITTPRCWSIIHEASAGWKQSGNKWWYQNIDGSYPKNTWKEIGGKWYHFDANGYMQTGWLYDGGRWYYLDASGRMQTGWVCSEGKWYYLESNGVMAVSKWIDNTFYVKSNGVMAVNEWINDKYYVGADGRWVQGKQNVGWKQDRTGWWYLNADGTYPKSCWKIIGGKYYYFNASGYMQTGWIYYNSYWFYLESSGAMATNKWIENKYFVKANGAMAVNEWVDGGKYYVDRNGVWVKGKTK